MNYLELAQQEPPLAPGVRLRVALDVVHQAVQPPPASALPRRATVADVRLEPSGRAQLDGEGHISFTLLWEILASRPADSDDPWADPADDLHPDVLGVFASMSVRPPSSVHDLAARFADACLQHASDHAAVQSAMRGGEGRTTVRTPPLPVDEAPLATRPAPPMTLRTLAALSVSDEEAQLAGHTQEEMRSPSPPSSRTTGWKSITLGAKKPRSTRPRR